MQLICLRFGTSVPVLDSSPALPWIESNNRRLRMVDLSPLDNIVWHALAGAQQHFACGTPEVKRYARGFSPIIGFVHATKPNLNALLPFCEPAEHFYTDNWSGPVPPGWRIDSESTMFKMIWHGDVPVDEDGGEDAVPLCAQHAAAALQLATLTRPGPFGPRTIELGEYFGYFEGSRLIAMAGERMHTGRLREISGVCTHPTSQGRGLARRLMYRLLRRQMHRGETPFLHVMHDNSSARGLYERMGFRNYRETVVRVISAT